MLPKCEQQYKNHTMIIVQECDSWMLSYLVSIICWLFFSFFVLSELLTLVCNNELIIKVKSLLNHFYVETILSCGFHYIHIYEYLFISFAYSNYKTGEDFNLLLDCTLKWNLHRQIVLLETYLYISIQFQLIPTKCNVVLAY